MNTKSSDEQFTELDAALRVGTEKIGGENWTESVRVRVLEKIDGVV